MVNAKKENGLNTCIEVISEIGGKTKIKLPLNSMVIDLQQGIKILNQHKDFIEVEFEKNGKLVLINSQK